MFPSFSDAPMISAPAADREAAIGLIHSHPRHDLFLSSIDQHNLYKFQRDEAIAVSGVYSGMFMFLFFHQITFLSQCVILAHCFSFCLFILFFLRR